MKTRDAYKYEIDCQYPVELHLPILEINKLPTLFLKFSLRIFI